MKAFLADMLTGRRVLNLPHDSASWTQTLNDTDSVTVTIPLYAASQDAASERLANDARILDLRNTAALGKTVLVVEDEGKLVGGPIMERSYDSATSRLTLTAAGMWSYFDHRVLLPPAAASKPLVKADGTPDTSLDMSWSKVTWNTIARNIVEQAMNWPNGHVPVVLEDAETGSSEVNYTAVDLNIVGEVLSNITERENGCDIMFVCQRQEDGLGFEWRMVTGHPLIQAAEHRFNANALNPGLTDLNSSETADSLATRCWFSAGKSDDKVLVASAYSTLLTDAGAPCWDMVNSEHSTVKILQTLQDYATEAAGVYYLPVSSTECKIHRDYLTSIARLSLANLNVGDLMTFRTTGDWFFADGEHTRRITALSATEDDDWVTVTLGDVFSTVTIDEREDA